MIAPAPMARKMRPERKSLLVRRSGFMPGAAYADKQTMLRPARSVDHRLAVLSQPLTGRRHFNDEEGFFGVRPEALKVRRSCSQNRRNRVGARVPHREPDPLRRRADHE